jgi:hypothetical protein
MKKCIITVFFLVDNFYKIFKNWEKNNLLASTKTRQRDGNLTLSELLALVLFFYLSPCRDFKNYYLYYIPSKYPNYFKLVGYSRIVQLWQRLVLPVSIIMYMLTGERTGIYFVESTKLAICHNKRTSSNRVFKRIAKSGVSSYGHFLGFKLHLIINNKGEIMAIKITKGNKSDLSAVSKLTKELQGKLFADKGYISKEVFDDLFQQDLRLFTGIRKNMKNHLLELKDKKLSRKRVLIESVFNVLKNHIHLQHTRHRSQVNFLVHIIASVTAYAIKKSHLKLQNLPNHSMLLS